MSSTRAELRTNNIFLTCSVMSVGGDILSGGERQSSGTDGVQWLPADWQHSSRSGWLLRSSVLWSSWLETVSSVIVNVTVSGAVTATASLMTIGPPIIIIIITAIEVTQEIGRRITVVTEDTRETEFLFKRLSMALPRGMRSPSKILWSPNEMSLQPFTLFSFNISACGFVLVGKK